ncbi:MAG: AAA family ATPase, partial [Acinetobacter sp.]|nr:AAA family ATPase [Acinetobacter sp.]
HSQAIRPIVYEDFPSLQRLFGYIAHDAHAPQAANHLDLQAGTLLKANGGFLIVELEQILQQPQVWHILKHALQCRHWQWSSLQHLMPATRLQVSDIPLQLTVILLAEPETYDDLLLVDQDLARLFKIRADFTDTLPRQAEHELSFVQWIADYIQQDQLLPFDREALAEILTDASHRAEDQNALSLHGASLSELLRESHFHAMQAQSDGVKACHVQTALKQRLYRLGYWRELYWQDLSQGTQLIETQGQRLGQVNALSVIQYADSEFGFPSRLTASVCQGAGDILDIERSVELGGSLHAKGTLLMSSFLKSHFGRQQILNFSAALAFEQSYGEVDGDSATVAELSALISAISQIPIHQSWAITGSMNQLGQVQPVGGINAKIEGFFDACQLQGLTGSQGVIIPRQNIQHLMLRQDIIDAVQQGKFHVHAIDHVEQALEILMNRPVGEFNAQGQYSPHSIYAAVMQQLAQWQESETELLLEEKPKAKKKKAKKKAKHKQDDDLSAQEQT